MRAIPEPFNNLRLMYIFCFVFFFFFEIMQQTMYKNFGKKLMKREGLVLDDRSTSGEFQFLAVKFPFALVRVCVCRYREHQKNTKKPRNNTKTTNHFYWSRARHCR